MIDGRIASWLLGTDTGLSSKAIVAFLGAGVAGGGAPGDLNDVGRCLRLLDRVPEWRPRMTEMAGASKRWRRFAQRWAALEAALIEESGGRVREGAYGWGDGDFSRSRAIMEEIEAEGARG